MSSHTNTIDASVATVIRWQCPTSTRILEMIDTRPSFRVTGWNSDCALITSKLGFIGSGFLFVDLVFFCIYLIAFRRAGLYLITEHCRVPPCRWWNTDRSVCQEIFYPTEVNWIFVKVTYRGKVDSFSQNRRSTEGEAFRFRQRAFFSSPTIRYAAQSCYATPIHFTSQIDRKMYSAKMVLRCRQKPGSFVVQKETLNNNQMMNIDFCDFVSDEQIEWRTEQRGSVIFDSLCVRLKPLSDNPSHKSTSTASSRFPLK